MTFFLAVLLYLGLCGYAAPIILRLPVIYRPRNTGRQVEVGQAGVVGLAAAIVAVRRRRRGWDTPPPGHHEEECEYCQQKQGAKKLVHSSRKRN